ncbi:ATP-binding protein [Candidatus Micrarchaeota archaeon]|nr:ATP-binding protein [Candidatus Micrarchaeota archaeon]
MAEISELMEMFNPWWKTKEYSTELKKREILKTLNEYIKEKQVITLNGMRRAGKTSIMRLLIEKLVKEEPPQNILFFSFDGLKRDSTYLEEVIKEYERLVAPKGKKYIFLDEIQFIDGWEWIIKRFYDSGDYKFILSGSSSFSILKSAGKALVGRTFDFHVTPLKLSELFYFKNKKIPTITLDEIISESISNLEKRFFIYRKAAETETAEYLMNGGLPEIISIEHEKAVRYVRDSVVDKVIFRDITETFEVVEPTKIKELFYSLLEHPGALIESNTFLSKLDISRKTLSKYLEYLKLSYLIKEVHNYTGRESKSLRKTKRYYVEDNSLLMYLKKPPEIGRFAENAAVLACDAKYFWRERNKEVDIILQSNGNILPAEVKYTNNISNKDLQGLFSFASRFNINNALVVTKDILSDEEREYYGQKLKIRFIPLWMFLLQS